MQYITHIKYIIITTLALFLFSCGGGGGTSLDSTNKTINAFISKGPVDGAQCYLYDDDNNQIAGPKSTTAGSVSFNIITDNKVVYIKCSGGKYIDESTGLELDAPELIGGKTINSQTTTLVASPITMIAFNSAKNAGNLHLLDSYNLDIADELGLDGIDIATIIPKNLATQTATNDSEGLYGIELAKFSQMARNYQASNTATVNSSTAITKIIEEFTNDLQDGTLNNSTNTAYLDTAEIDLKTQGKTSIKSGIITIDFSIIKTRRGETDNTNGGEAVDTNALKFTSNSTISANQLKSSGCCLFASCFEEGEPSNYQLSTNKTNTTYSIITQPSKGTIALSVNGSYTYGFDSRCTDAVCSDSFVIQAQVGSEVVTQTIFVTQNSTPIAQNMSIATTQPSITSSFNATDDNPLTFSIASQPQLGSVIINNDKWTYNTSPTTIANQDSFSFIATDGVSNSETKTITIDLTKLDADNDSLSNIVENKLGTDIVSTKTWSGAFIANDDATKYNYRVANRLAYGVNKSLIDELKLTGVDTWIEQQLSNPQTNLNYNPLDGYNYTQNQLDNQSYRRVDNTSKAFNTHAAARAILTKNQLQTVMWRFWDNHFSTETTKHGWNWMEIWEADQFYIKSLGNFKDLLLISAKSPVMSYYLDGHTNKKDAANENYAREIMELHTLGVTGGKTPLGNTGGYTAKDIAELARIFTGWSYTTTSTQPTRYKYYFGNTPENRKIYQFKFNTTNHDDGVSDYDSDGLSGDKTFLENLGNYTITSRGGESGVNEGLEAIDILAKHPKTAEYICYKLAQFFISDTPSVDTLNACKTQFLAGAGTIGNNDESPTQIADTLRALFATDEFKTITSDNLKLKDSQEYILSIGRLMEVNPLKYNEVNNWYYNFGLKLISVAQGFTNEPSPTGYPEISSEWNKTDVALKRITQNNYIIHDNRWAINWVDFFTNKGMYTLKDIIQFIVPTTTAGNYTNADIKRAYDILAPNGVENLNEDNLRKCIAEFTQRAEFNIQ